ncbi:hypothetical protein NP233_g8097 [Leucocoprinus birnbaumii]|uniref:Protein kinase domain-containing protein n=1 Tax=Leucocoprinus birnbaumii TaxID=56174 RepID=A0AAD5VN18_9AGAR|nr:hypothetical protein NP233_g8097 [Leucocoprinus birnbaumii]
MILRGVQTDPRYFASGGFADIFRGRWTKRSGDSVKVAVKLARRRNVDDRTSQERTRKKFLREAKLWAQLHNRNVVPFYGLIFEQGYPGLVMPYYENGDLVCYLQRSPSVDKLNIISDIAGGLNYLHGFRSNPVIHGDIKASNIMITDSGEACLTDFGLAKILYVPGYTTSSPAGTCRWMSPEILDGDDFYPTTASDIWAFAMTILEVNDSSAIALDYAGTYTLP